MEAMLFWGFGALAILGAAGLVFFKAPLYGALSVVVCLMAVAGLYLILHAQALFLIQMVVYAGAIMVLSVLVLMFFNISPKGLFKRFGLKEAVFAVPVIVLFFIFLSFGINFDGGIFALSGLYSVNFGEVGRDFGDLKSLGFYLFNNFGVSFEAVSLLLTAALIGVVSILKGKNG